MRRRHEPPAFLYLLIFYACLVMVNGTGSQTGAFISLLFLASTLHWCSAVGVTDKCSSPILAEVLGHGWAPPPGPQGLWWYWGSWGCSRAQGQPGQWFWGPQWLVAGAVSTGQGPAHVCWVHAGTPGPSPACVAHGCCRELRCGHRARSRGARELRGGFYCLQ